MQLHSVSNKTPAFFASCLLLLHFKYVSMSDFVHSNSLSSAHEGILKCDCVEKPDHV